MRKLFARLLCFSVVLLLSVAAGILLTGHAGDLSGLEEAAPMTPEAPQEPEAAPAKAESFNILLCGTDGSNSRTDTMLLVRFDGDQNRVNITSLPRDTKITLDGRVHKLNSCVPLGGKELLIDTVKQLTGAPVDYYAFVDFEGFRNVIDLLGGVELDVEQDFKYSDPAQNLYIDLKAGVQVLDGKKAEQYVRYRRYAQADIARNRNQQKFLSALIEQKNKPQYWVKAPEIFAQVLRYTETNFTLGALINHLDSAKSLSGDSIFTYQIPGHPDDSKISYYIWDEGAEEIFQTYFGAPAQ